MPEEKERGPTAGSPGAADPPAGPPPAGPPPSGQALSLDFDAARLLYGALVAAAALAVAAGAGDPAGEVLLATAGTLVVYWLAHVYTRVLADRLATPGEPLRRRVGEAVRHEAGIITGGLPSVAAFGLSALAGATISAAALVAVAVAVCMLGAAGFVAASRAAVGGLALVAETAAAGVLGVLIAALKTFSH